MTGDPWSVQMGETLMARGPLLSRRWHYEPGVALLALSQLWAETGEQRIFDFIQYNLDEFVGADGGIRTYRLGEYNLDQINEGRLLFFLYDATGDQRYRQAACLLREQLRKQPRTRSGGFWHKEIYPHQMWLDGIYMASPFYAEFGRRFGEPEAFGDVAWQITLIEKHTRNPETGLLYHAWDESRSQAWADPLTGCSPNFWGRAMGWFAMAVLDVLDHFPQDHPQRRDLLAIFRATMDAVVRVQDPASGVWYQVLDQGDRLDNYLESSASCMFVYALAKGVGLGYLDDGYLAAAQSGYDGILREFVTLGPHGVVNLDGICAVAGLGGKPYRDGSYEYYVGEKTIANEYKGAGPFIMASLELERVAQL